jgi:hypothetical protein
VNRVTQQVARLAASWWVPPLLVLLALAVCWHRWGSLVTARRPTTPPLTALERRYGPGYDRRFADERLVQRLRRPLPSDFAVKGTLTDAIDAMRDQKPHMDIFVNWRALESAGFKREAPVDEQLGGLPADDALERLLAAAAGGSNRIGFTVDDGVVTISTREDLAKNVNTRVYDLRDLLPPANAGPARAAAEAALADAIQKEVDSASSPLPYSRSFGDLTIQHQPRPVRFLQGQAIVTQTPANQHDIVRLFERRRWHADLRTFARRVAPVIGAAVAAGLLQRLVVRWLRKRAVARVGLCPRCGYDLRATPARCPECGHEREPGAAAVSVPAGARSVTS